MAVMNSRKNLGFSTLEMLLFVVVVVVLGFIFGYVSHRQGLRPMQIRRSISSSSFMSGRVKVTYINMPGLVDFTAGTIHQVDEQNGNYIYAFQNPKTFCRDCADPYVGNGRIVYDGQIIYSGQLESDSPLLSDNGLHFIYAVPNGPAPNVNLYYLDNTYLPASPAITQSLVAIGNTGYSYAYTTDSNNSLYVNSNNKFTYLSQDGGIDQPVLDGNTVNFLTGVIENPATRRTDIVYDGKILTTDGDTASLDNAISNNGVHYFYSTDTKVVVDRATVATIDQTPPRAEEIFNSQVTNDGNYAYVLCNQSGQGTVYFDSHHYNSGLNCGPKELPIITMNDDGSDTFYSNPNSHSYFLNGKPLKLNGKVNSAQFVGTTLYVYRWVK